MPNLLSLESGQICLLYNRTFVDAQDLKINSYEQVMIINAVKYNGMPIKFYRSEMKHGHE